MKRLLFVMGLAACVAVPLVAQPIGGPIELKNPHRRGDAPTTGGIGGGGLGQVPPPPNVDGGGGASYWGPMFQQPPLPMPPVPTPPSVAMFADGTYLFVLRGDSLFQYDKKTLKLINSTELPPPAAPVPPPVPVPAPDTAESELRTHTSPPLRPGPGLKN